LAFAIPDGQAGVNLGNLLGDQPLVEALALIDLFLEPVTDRLEGEQCLAGFVHELDLLLVAPR
jgi:hypothetical protein